MKIFTSLFQGLALCVCTRQFRDVTNVAALFNLFKNCCQCEFGHDGFEIITQSVLQKHTLSSYSSFQNPSATAIVQLTNAGDLDRLAWSSNLTRQRRKLRAENLQSQ